MSREQQVAQVITDLRDYVPTSMDDAALDFAARQILATLLPQVTTVAELEALPDKTVLTDPQGQAWAIYTTKYGALLRPANQSSPRIALAAVLQANSPLTVVWQPSEDAS